MNEYELADKLKKQFRGRGAAVSGIAATSTSELLKRATSGRDPNVNVSEEAFRENYGAKRMSAQREGSRPSGSASDPSRPRPESVPRPDSDRVNEEITRHNHIPYDRPRTTADPSRPGVKAASRQTKRTKKAAAPKVHGNKRVKPQPAEKQQEVRVKRGRFPVALFALCMILKYTFGSYLVCMFLPIGYVMTAAGFAREAENDRRVAAVTGLVFAAVYAVLILLVYYAQTTVVRLEELTPQAKSILDYRHGGLLFDYDLLGYGMMALSTFFLSLSMRPAGSADKWLKALMLIHGVFFLSCFFLPMTGMFTSMGGGEAGNGGTIALLCWCAYFLPVGVLSWRHFGKR